MRLNLLFTLQHGTHRDTKNTSDNVRGWIYGILRAQNSAYATKLHDTGSYYEKKRFKPFVYSRLTKRKSVEGLKEVYELAISSIDPKFIASLMAGMTSPDPLIVHNGGMLVMSEMKMSSYNHSNRFAFISPCVLLDGRDFLNRYDEFKFTVAVDANLRRKYAALKGVEPEGKITRFAFLKPPSFVKTVACGKDFYGYYGIFELRGDPALIELAYGVGIGAKNASGFGMIEKISTPANKK